MIAAFVTALAFAAPATAKESPDHTYVCGRKCKASKMHRACSQRNPKACVKHVILHNRLKGSWKAQWLMRIPSCESTWNPLAYNPSGASGLFQFMPGTYASTPYGHHSIWSPFWQSYAALWMLNQGRQTEWSCN